MEAEARSEHLSDRETVEVLSGMHMLERAGVHARFAAVVSCLRTGAVQVMAHKHLQRRIEKWVRARGMPSDEDTKADSLKAAMQSSFDEPDLAPQSLSGHEEEGAPVPGSPGASTTAPSTVGASTIGPSSIHKLVRPLFSFYYDG